MKGPVTQERIQIAQEHGLVNVRPAALMCREARLPFWAACALLSMESGGRNIYGRDKGGVFASMYPLQVDAENFVQFLVRVMNGETSNGVGPCQITYAGSLEHGHRYGGLFTQMIQAGLMPWSVRDNMLFGFRLMRDNFDREGTWQKAGTVYNGSPEYGLKFVQACNDWRGAFGMKRTVD